MTLLPPSSTNYEIFHTEFHALWESIPEDIMRIIQGNTRLVEKTSPKGVMNSILERLYALMPDDRSVHEKALRIVKSYNAIIAHDSNAEMGLIEKVSYLWNS